MADSIARRSLLKVGAMSSAALAAGIGAPLAAHARDKPLRGNADGSPYRIVRDIDRPDPKLIERLKKCGATYPVAFSAPLTIGAQYGLPRAIQPIRPRLEVMGPAFTVLANDHLMPMYATLLAKPGDVLVVDSGGESDICIWGGSMTKSAVVRKLGGIVLNGTVCDSSNLIGPNVEAIRDIPIFCLGHAPASDTWEKPGSINVPINIGGRIIGPGDLIIGGDDGVAYVPKDKLLEAVETAERFTAEAHKWHQNITAGKTWFEVLGLDKTIEKLAIPESPR